MLFNSRIFIFIFFPILLIVYYGLHKLKKHEIARISLILASFIFYGYNHVSYLILLIASIVLNYLAYLLMEKCEKEKRSKFKFLVAFLSVIANIGVLFYFKYFDFFLTNCNKLLHTDYVTRNILLPLGISFFTFQQISFIVDSYKGEIKGYSFWDYALFVSFFPQLVAGPIVLHDELIPQFKDESRYSVDWDRFSTGLKYFIIGLSKKTILADSFSKIADAGFIDNMSWDAASVILITVGYVIQLYFDFSGYSDMAIGLGKMLGFDLPVNFDMPLKSENQVVFWKRWHTSLIRFLTRYVYFPLGGSKKGVFRTYINIMMVFIISGIWHGAGWTYIAWGILCGLGSITYRLFGKWFDKLPKFMGVIINFSYFVFTCTFFRAAYMSQAFNLFKCLKNIGFNGSLTELCTEFIDGISETGSVVITLVSFVAALVIIFFAPSSHQMAAASENSNAGENVTAISENGSAGEKTAASIFGSKYSFVFYGVLAALCILTFANVSTFIYFNF